MIQQKIKDLTKKGEGISIEFKECKTELTKDVYPTICAFLNRNGRELLLGVNDSRVVVGIDKDKIEQIRKDLINKARTLAINQNSNHPWKKLTNIELLKSAKLYTKDYQTNEEGITLAGILLFGKDDYRTRKIDYRKCKQAKRTWSNKSKRLFSLS